MSVPDPYRVLQIEPTAGADVIEAAYKRLAKKFHPDIAPGPDAQARMVQINLARDILRDPVRRAAVDRARARAAGTAARVVADEGRGHAAAGPHTSSGHAPSGHASRTGHGSTQVPGAPERRAGRVPHWPFPGMVDPGTTFDDRGSTGWGGGRSTEGYRYDPGTMGTGDGYGAAGPPPGNPSGSLLNFGRYSGWSLAEIARTDLEYLEWLDRMPIGRIYAPEIDKLLRQHGRRSSTSTQADSRHGLHRRR